MGQQHRKRTAMQQRNYYPMSHPAMTCQACMLKCGMLCRQAIRHWHSQQQLPQCAWMLAAAATGPAHTLLPLLAFAAAAAQTRHQVAGALYHTCSSRSSHTGLQ